MKRFSEQFHTKSQTVKLKKAEQALLRDRIVSYMEYHPLPADMKAAAPAKKVAVRQPVLRDQFATYQVPFANLFKFGGTFAAIVLLVVPFVANQAMPGDTLYAVKVNFNEEVRSTLTWGSYDKVEWETVRLNRRIAEAKLLQKEGRLTAEVEASTAAAVKQHADNAKAEIATLSESDADTAAIATIELDANLALQARSFDSEVRQAASTTSAGTTLIADAIDASLVPAPALAITSLPSLEKLTARVQQSSARVRELEQTLGGQAEAKVMTDVTRRIEDLDRLSARAWSLPESEVVEAKLMLMDVIARAQTLIVYMTELDVRETVAIETALPVVLTEDEMNQSRSERDTQIDVYLSQIAATEIEDELLLEKLAAITEQITEVQTNLATIEAYEAYLAASDKALALGKDALILMEQAGITVVTPVFVPTATSTDPVATSTATTTEEVIVEEPEIQEVEPVATTTEEVVESEPETTPVVEESEVEVATTTEEVEVVEERVDVPAENSSSTEQTQA